MKTNTAENLHAPVTANATKAPAPAGLDPEFVAALIQLYREADSIRGEIDWMGYGFDALNTCNDAATVVPHDADAANAVYYLATELCGKLGPLEQRAEAHSSQFRAVLRRFVPDYASGFGESPAVASPAQAQENTPGASAEITRKQLSAVEDAILGYGAMADGIKAQISEIISRRGDADESLLEDLNRLLLNFTHAFAATHKNAETELGKLFAVQPSGSPIFAP